jgi:type I restriction enzyme M protein
MALKKFELYSSLWKSFDELRGGMDASQYKDYVSTLSESTPGGLQK